MKEQLKINQVAYKKIIFHCLRYPSSKVYGTLIRHKQSKQINDAYPLFHSSLTRPVLNIALNLIQSNLSSAQELAGFYEYTEENTASLSRVLQYNQQLKNMFTLIVKVQNQNVQLLSNRHIISSPAFSTLKSQLKQGKHRLIVDMDAHLQEPELDFTNQAIQ